jgi:hypothetical protein
MKKQTAKAKVKYENRELWLAAAVKIMKPLFKRAGYAIPKVRISCGWPSSRGLGTGKWTAGECWDKSAATDEVAQIFISPRMKAEAAEVLPVLAHEVCHAVVGNKEKHGKVFKKCFHAVGMVGKATQCNAGPEFLEQAAEWVKQSLGEYPHAVLKPSGRPTKKQTTRMVKCECKECGYVVRTSRKWLDDAGAVLCPCNSKPMSFELPDADADADDEGGDE